jgi:cellulose synthase operon protein YhjQ
MAVSKIPPVPPPRDEESAKGKESWVGPAMPMINRRGRGAAVVVDVEILRELVERVATLERTLEQQGAAPEQRQLPEARQRGFEFGFDQHGDVPRTRRPISIKGGRAGRVDEQTDFPSEIHGEISLVPPDSVPQPAPAMDGEAVPLSGPSSAWPVTIPPEAGSPNAANGPRSVPDSLVDAMAQAAADSAPAAPMPYRPPALPPGPSSVPPPAWANVNPFESRSFFSSPSLLSVAPGTASLPALEGRKADSSPGISADVARLFSAFGTPTFKYREIAARERTDRVTATAELHGRPVMPRDVQFAPDPTPRVVRRPLTVAVIGLSRGVGRTTIAANLAAALSQRLARAVVIGLDPRNDLTTHFGGFEKQIGLVNRSTPLDRLRSIKSGTVCIPFGANSPASVREVEELLADDPGWLEERLLPTVINASEMWILDTPAAEGVLLDSALALSDIVVIATTCDSEDLSAMARLEEGLRSESLHSQHLPPYVLLNRFDNRRDIDRAAQASLVQHWGSRLVPVTIHEDVIVKNAAASRSLVMQVAPNAQVTADFAALADWVRSRKPRSRRDGTRMVRG